MEPKLDLQILREAHRGLRKKIEKGKRRITQMDLPYIGRMPPVFRPQDKWNIYRGRQEGFEICETREKDLKNLFSADFYSETIHVPYNCKEGAGFFEFQEALEKALHYTGPDRYLLAWHTGLQYGIKLPHTKGVCMPRGTALEQIKNDRLFPKSYVLINKMPADKDEYRAWARGEVSGPFMTVIARPDYTKPWKETVYTRRNQLWLYMAWLSDMHGNRTF